jgi:hypothetical protein
LAAIKRYGNNFSRKRTKRRVGFISGDTDSVSDNKHIDFLKQSEFLEEVSFYPPNEYKE